MANRMFMVALGFCSSLVWAETLPQLNIDSDRFAVAGLSSGGMMASQLAVAYSSQIKGVAVFAGGIFGCADKHITKSGDCLTHPELPEPKIVEYLKSLEGEDLIDPISNIEQQRVYLFRGVNDEIVKFRTVKAVAKFYELLKNKNIEFDMVSNAGHGQPTVELGNQCDSSSAPWILKCGINGAQAAMKVMFGPLRPADISPVENLHWFEQSEFLAPDSMMSSQGLIYIPKYCQSGEKCRLLVVLHGCGQSSDSIDTIFAENAGYNEIAEANHIVVLYPAVKASIFRNAQGCWDWWGYTGDHVIDKKAPQMQSIIAMVRHLRGGK